MREDFVNNPGAVPSGEELARGESTSPFTVHKLSPKNIELLRRITGDDIRSVTHPKGLPINLFNFLHQVLRFDVISTNKDGEPSFLNEQGKIEVRSSDGTTSLLEPQKLSDFLMRAKAEIGDTIEFTPEEKVTAVVPKILTDEEYKNLDRSSRYERDTVELPENGTQPGESDSSSDPDDFLDTEDKYPTLEMPTNEEDPEEDTYDDEEKFIEHLGMLGLQVIARKGDMYTVQSYMPGAGPVTVSRSELISQIESKDDLVPPQLEEEVSPYIDALIMTPEKLHERFVQPMKEERNNFVGPQIPNDLRYERGRVEGLTEKEEAYDFSQIPIRQRTSPALAHEVQKANEKVREMESHFFDTRFETQFGISKEDLIQIKGFEKLSAGQQKLLFDNLVQFTIQSVRNEAKDILLEKAVERKTTVGEKVSPIIGKVFSFFSAKAIQEERTVLGNNVGRALGEMLAGFRSAVMSTYDTIETEKNALERMRSGGIELHKDLLTKLIGSLPRVHEDPDTGALIVDLVNIQDRATDREIRGVEWTAMTELNKVAHELARIPASWRDEVLGAGAGQEWKTLTFLKDTLFKNQDRENGKIYAEVEERYKKARKVLREVLEMKGRSALESEEILLGLDSRVHQMQTLQTNPEALEELARIGNPSLFRELGNSMAGPGAYMALGYAFRTMGGAALGFVGAPLAASGIASLRSWNRTEAELRERDRNATRGITDDKEGALNVVDADSLTKRTTYLLEQCQKSTGEKKAKFLAMLRNRVTFIHDKQMLNRVNYGSVDGMITAQSNLAKIFSESLIYLTAEERASDTDVEAKVSATKSRLGHFDLMLVSSIIDARKEGRRADMAHSAIKAASFATAGALLRHMFVKGEALDRAQSGPQTAFKGDLPFVPRPSETNLDPLTRAIIEKVPPNNFIENLAPKIDGGLSLPPDTPAEWTTRTGDSILPEATPTVPATESYEIKSGDTLTKILKEEIPEIKELGASPAQESAVARVLARLTPNELRAIGIDSDSVNKIRAGDTLNIAKLKEMVSADLSLLDTDAVTTSLQTPSVEEASSSGAREESIREATTTTEQPARPGQVRPEFRSSTLPSEAVPRAEVASPPNNVVELAPIREAKAVQERVIETLKLKKDWSAVSGRSTSDLSEAVRTNSAESPALRRALKDALFAEQTLTKTLKLEERTNETVGEFMKRAAKEIAKLSPEAQNELYEKITPKGNGTFTTPEPLFRPGQIRPNFEDTPVSKVVAPEILGNQGESLQANGRPPLNESAQTRPGGERVKLVGDVLPPKMSPEFNRYLINSRQIPLQSWDILRDKPVSNFEFMDIQMGDMLKDPAVPNDTKKMIFLRRLLFEETGLAGKPGEELEDYFKRADDFIQGHEEVKDRYLNRIVGPYQEFVREIDNTSTYESQPKQGGWRVRPSFRRR